MEPVGEVWTDSLEVVKYAQKCEGLLQSEKYDGDSGVVRLPNLILFNAGHVLL